MMKLAAVGIRRVRLGVLAVVGLSLVAATAAVAADGRVEELAAGEDCCFEPVTCRGISVPVVPIELQCLFGWEYEDPPGGPAGLAFSASVGLRACFDGFCSGLQDSDIDRTGAGVAERWATVQLGEETTILPPATLVPERTVCVGNTCNPEVGTPGVGARGAKVTVGDSGPIAGVAIAGATLSITPPPVCVSVLAPQCSAGAGGGTEQVSATTDLSQAGASID